MTRKEQARYRAIIRQIAGMRARGWDRHTHGDFDILEAELNVLGAKLILHCS